MSTITLDPATAITKAVDELLDELRQALAGDVAVAEVDGLLDRISKALRSARGKVGRARKRAAAVPAPVKPTVPAVKPAEPKRTAPAAGDKPTKPAPGATVKPAPKPGVPARTTPAPRKTVTIPRATPAPSPPRPTTSTTAPKPVPTVTPQTTPRPAPSRARHRRRPTRPTWLLPVLLVAAVLTALTAAAGIGWTVATTVLGTAAWWTRDRWLPITTTIRPKRGTRTR